MTAASTSAFAKLSTQAKKSDGAQTFENDFINHTVQLQ